MEHLSNLHQLFPVIVKHNVLVGQTIPLRIIGTDNIEKGSKQRESVFVLVGGEVG